MNTLSSKEIENQVFNIQKQWAKSIVEIGKAFLDKKDYVIVTYKFLDDLYSFKQGKILFKPTKASQKQFRRNKNEFVSYFIGHNKVSEEDQGFALKPWKSIYFENFDIITFDKISLSMGNFFFTDYQNIQIKVEYSFGYIFDQDNKLKIIFHHSSIPYKA